MNRMHKKNLAKEVKALSDIKVFEFMKRMCDGTSDQIVKASLEILNKEFGFGQQRQQKFVDALKKKINNVEVENE